MNYLVDTCVLSEVVRETPNKKVLEWLSQTPESSLFVSVLTFGEFHKGIEKLPASKKKDRLHKWVNSDLRERFKNRILDVEILAATAWGKIQGEAESEGKPMPSIDGLIAATAIANDLVVVTRNVKDMAQSGVAILNPWD